MGSVLASEGVVPPSVETAQRSREVFQAIGGPLGAVEAGAAAVAAPLLVFPNRFSPLALVLLAAVWLARLLFRDATLRRTPADWPLVGFLLMVSVSLYPSIDLALSRPKLYGLVLGVYVFSVVIEHLRTPLWQKALAALLVLAGVGIALVGLIGTHWNPIKLPLLDVFYARLPRLIPEVQTSVGPLEGGFGSNEVGGTLILLLPFTLALALFASRWGARLVLGGAAAATFGVLTLTASRSALLGAAIALPALIVLRWPRLALALPLAFLGLLGTILALGPGRFGAWLLATETAAGSSARVRIEIWSAAYDMIQDRLFTGIGLNNFPVLVNLLYPVLSAPETRIPHAHNLLLQVAADLGLLGLASFLGLVVVVGLSLFRAWKRSSGWERGLAAGLIAGLLGHLVFGLTDAVALGAKPGLLLWAMLGVAVALGLPAQGASGPGNGVAQDDETGESQPAELPEGAGLVHWIQWALFALACALGLAIAAGIRMVP